MDDTPAKLLALSLAPGIGVRAIREVLAATETLNLPLADLMGLPERTLLERMPAGGDRVCQTLRQLTADRADLAQSLMVRSRRAGVQPLTLQDADYPHSLRTALGEDAPPLLFVFGDIELLEAAAGAVVGTRQPSESGCACAHRCAALLVERGLLVVSGRAQGVDTAAHEAALERGGRTVYVLPEGILTVRMSDAEREAAEEGRATFISEFAPHANWETHAAVRRNATISALSRVVCVIEPRKVGGSIRTARIATEQGKPVLFYAPGPDQAGMMLRSLGAIELDGPDAPSIAALLDGALKHRPPATPQSEFLF